MADIFGRNIKYAGGFLPENTTISFSGMTTGGIVRNISIEYQQSVSRIWDLGSGRCFFVAGQPSGVWGIGKIGGLSGVISIIGKYTVCNPGTVTFAGNTGMCTNGKANASAKYTLSTVITSQIRMSVTSDDMIINEGVGGTFMSLSV